MSTPAAENPEIAHTITAAGIATNYHDRGDGPPLVLLHGSGPGVSAWANWRLVVPTLSQRFRVIAPDMVGFGFTERPAAIEYGKDTWVRHAIGLLDALELDRVDLLGNSFGGALALALAIRHPDRVGKLILMGAVGTSFPITAGLDAAWGYTPSIANMRRLLDVFAFDRTLVTDELAELRYQASIRPGFQESFAAMFPAPRQRWVDALASEEDSIRRVAHDTLVIHGREDQVIPLGASYHLFSLLERAQLHVFARCGHWTQIEHAAAFSKVVTDFLI